MISATRHIGDEYRRAGLWGTRTTVSYVEQAAAEVPDRLAVVDGDRRLSYADLWAATASASAGLAGLGVGRGDVVTIQLPNWWEFGALHDAATALGAASNPVIPIYRDADVGFIVRQARPRVVVIPHRFRGFDYVEMHQRLRAGGGPVTPVVVVRPEGELPAGFLAFDDVCTAPAPPPTIAARPGDVALLLYTSGTTADPKGVLHTHETLVFELGSVVPHLALDSSMHVFMASPVTHITGVLLATMLPPVLQGAVTLLDVWSPQRAVDLIERDRCTFTVSATPFLQGIVDEYAQRGGPSSLTCFACGGADVPPDLVRRGRELMGTSIVRIYGSTELPSFSCGRPDADEELAAETDGTVIEPGEARLDDVHDGVGELLVRGPDLFVGYLDGSLNDEAFTDDGFFRSGDLASIRDDGAVVIRGRKKDIIIRSGENISAKEVEDLLYEHPHVAEVAIVAMPDPRTGERACAFVVPVSGRAPTLADLCGFLEDRRVTRQKFPEHLELVDELPKTASGKVQKFLLRARVAGEATAG